jgi:hypothetical protein
MGWISMGEYPELSPEEIDMIRLKLSSRPALEAVTVSIEHRAT